MIRARPLFALACLVLLAPEPLSAIPPSASVAAGRGAQRAPALIDNTTTMDANNLEMFVTNHGSYAFDLTTGNAGLIFPRGSTTSVVFAAGTWVGATVNGQIRVAVAEYSQEFVPGPMLNGNSLPDQPRFKNYKILRGNTTSPDYLNWPVQDGAPLDAVGNPLLLGDATIWSVFNDADPALHTNNAGRTLPLGLEIQQTTFAFNRPGPLGNVIFVKLKLRNRGLNFLDQVYASLWSDSDVGSALDDLVGCDTTHALGYAYNATNADLRYGSTPPAVGFQILKGASVPDGAGFTDIGMTAFTKYVNGTDPTSALETYNYLRGLHVDGDEMHVNDDTTAAVTRFQVSGDPVTGTGWLDTNPGDRRMFVITGPFIMAPGDEQEIIGAVLVARGADRLASIAALRETALATRAAYEKDFLLDFGVSAPSARVVLEGATLSFNVLANDPEGTPPEINAAPVPLGATFNDRGDGTGEFQWTPGFDQAGEYLVQFTAQRADGATATTLTRITVLDVNRAPIADAGGPYSTFVGGSVTFDGSGSSDPDGLPLTYTWAFGDGEAGTGVAPVHVYGVAGSFGVALTVSDGSLSDIATAVVTVLDGLVARIFTAGGNRTIRLGSGKSTWCAEIEPVGRSFDVASVDLASVVMKSEGTGSVSEIHAIGTKTGFGADRDGNGVAEITACFQKEDLRLLFANVQGSASLPVVFEGNVRTGGFFHAPSTIGIQGGGGPSSVAVSPSPLRTRGAFEFKITQPGKVSIRLFDVSGRLVRTITDEASSSAGYRRIEFDVRDDAGSALGAGIYFYRVGVPEGIAVGRLLVVR
ncbi:MAG TPA: PKD domain-containing protein [Candidatus Eisenbacteria bacterium]|nr:PKD domain-containing protein [Candidatus Eisenbacteria bacterium]